MGKTFVNLADPGLPPVDMRGSTEHFSSKNALTITPSDTADLSIPVRALYNGGEINGNITVVTVDGDTVLFANCPQGTVLPIQCKRVKSTGTTVTNVVGLV